MTEIKFIGEYSGFIFNVDGKAGEVIMNAKGYMVIIEPDVVVGEYELWEDFAKNHPEMAEMMIGVVKRKMNETIHFVNEMKRYQEEEQRQEATDLIPHVSPSSAEPDDIAYQRAYQ